MKLTGPGVPRQLDELSGEAARDLITMITRVIETVGSCIFKRVAQISRIIPTKSSSPVTRVGLALLFHVRARRGSYRVTLYTYCN